MEILVTLIFIIISFLAGHVIGNFITNNKYSKELKGELFIYSYDDIEDKDVLFMPYYDLDILSKDKTITVKVLTKNLSQKTQPLK